MYLVGVAIGNPATVVLNKFIFDGLNIPIYVFWNLYYYERIRKGGFNHSSIIAAIVIIAILIFLVNVLALAPIIVGIIIIIIIVAVAYWVYQQMRRST